MKNTDQIKKCYSTGCKNTATVIVTPKFDAPVMHMCDKCKPSKENRPQFMADMPFAYDVKPINRA